MRIRRRRLRLGWSRSPRCYNILSMDARTFRSWARLTHRKPGRLIEDAMVAVTAAVHGLTVVTRNVRDFKDFGVPTLNPFG
jgi:toxin FitB